MRLDTKSAITLAETLWKLRKGLTKYLGKIREFTQAPRFKGGD
jgi:hypothetical protein